MLAEHEEFLDHSPATHDLRILQVFYQRPKWFIETIETCGLLLFCNNLEDTEFFHEQAQ